MPLALPGIIATAIFTFIVALNDFLFALVLIGRDDLKTLAIGINEFFHMAVVDWGLIMAAGVMGTIPGGGFFVGGGVCEAQHPAPRVLCGGQAVLGCRVGGGRAEGVT